MNLRKIAAAAGFATGAALGFAPLATADSSSSWLTSIDTLLGGLSAPAASTLDYQVSFDGYDLLPTTDNSATATTIAGQFGLAIASGDGAKAIAEGGFGDNALASGTNALAYAGSTTTGATGFNFDSATDIGSNVDPSSYSGAPDGAYAGGGSLIGGVDSGASSNDTAQVIGNMGTDSETGFPGDGGNSGAFAGDSALIGDGATAGNGDTAYTSGNINGFGDGSAAVAGNGDSAYTTGTETGTNEGAFSGFGNYNSATADTNYTTDGAGVSATDGNYNYALVDGTNNSTASAGTGNNDLAEVLFTHGDASAQGGSNLYDIITPLGESTTPAAATAASDPAADDLSSTLSAEISSLNTIFQGDVAAAGGSASDYTANAQGFDVINPSEISSVQGSATDLTSFDYLVYGLNPASNLATDPGSYNVLNGALVEFDDAYNSLLYAADYSGNLIPATDLFGSATEIGAALGTGSDLGAAGEFFSNGLADLLGML